MFNNLKREAIELSSYRRNIMDIRLNKMMMEISNEQSQEERHYNEDK